MIWTLDLFFEAIDREEAVRVRADIEALLEALSWQQPINVGDLAERKPLVVFERLDQPVAEDEP